MNKSTSILFRNNFFKKFSIWSLFPALTPILQEYMEKMLKKLLEQHFDSNQNLFALIQE